MKTVEVKITPELKTATCEICGQKFEGRFCVERATEHELIPLTEAKFEIGDIILTLPEWIPSINIATIEKIYFNSDHKPYYNYGRYTEEYETLLKPDTNNAISETELLYSPDYEVLRKRILYLGIHSILREIKQSLLDIKTKKED